MRNEQAFLGSSGEIPVNQAAAPEFYRLYQQSVLLALKEQGALSEIQLRYCLDLLDHRHEKCGG